MKNFDYIGLIIRLIIIATITIGLAFILFCLPGCTKGYDEFQPNLGHDFEIDARLPIDENGYYHIQFLDGYTQTFTTLKAETGIEDHYQKVKWLSNKEILIAGYWTNLVNSSSYTDYSEGGKAYTVLGVWENFIGDTIKVYSGYTDNCNINPVDSLEVVIDDEE